MHSAVGIHLATHLKQPLDLEELLVAAREQGVVAYPLARFCSGPSAQQGLVFGFGAIDEAHITQGLARLKALLDARSVPPPHSARGRSRPAGPARS